MLSPRVAVARGATRYEAVRRALELIRSDIAESLEGKRRILVKPNLVSDRVQLAATHVDTVKAILDVVTSLSSSRVAVGEGSASDTFTGYRNFGYFRLRDEYGAELLDLNVDDYVEVDVFDRRFRRFNIRVSKTVYECDYRISAAVMKTHDTVIVTLSIKNMAVGSIIGYGKSMIHQGYQAINLNIYRIAKFIPVHLAVVDGFKAMEGDGPIGGEEVDMRVALAGLDPVAVDAVAAYMMGFNPMDVGYLYYCHRFGLGVADLDRIKVVGEDPGRLQRRFKPHRGYERQLNWRIPEDTLVKLGLD